MDSRPSFPSHAGRAMVYLCRLCHVCLLVVGVAAVLYVLGGDAQLSESGELGATGLDVSASEPASARELELSGEMKRVRDWVSRRYKVSPVVIEPALRAAEDSGRRLGVDPLLLVAMIAVESSFNPYAESSVGAQGLMQVIPRYHMDKIGRDASEDALFDPALNVHVGARVLHEGLRRYGSLETALQYYGGALNDDSAAYANKVLSMKRRLAGAARRGSGTESGTV